MLNQRCIFSAGLVLAFIAHFIGAVPCYADVQADGSVGTQVSPNDQQQTYDILGGSSAGQNLLHSFLKFSVEDGWTAKFQLPNNTNIFNIITRVTGTDPSSINGTLTINDVGHPVSLFLINPNGIIFGPNASLDLSGSFLASTAESITFSDGSRFSAKDPTPPSSVLTLGVPIGLQFGTNPGPIEGQFNAPGSGLFLTSVGQTLALVGGEVNLQGSPFNPLNRFDIPSLLAAYDGRLEIASVGAGTTVGLSSPNRDRSWALDWVGITNFNNITVGNGLILGGGLSDIFVYGRQIRLTDKVQVSGPIDSGIQHGLVFIYASDLLDLNNNSSISPVTSSSSTVGNINIQAKTLRLTNSQISAVTQTDDNNNSGQTSSVTIRSEQIFLTDNSIITTSSFSSALAGNIKITTNDLTINKNSNIFSAATQNGSAGTINIFARSILLDDNASIRANSNSGMGGNINLTVSDALLLRNQSNISTSSISTGNGGNITILAGIIAAVPKEDSNISTDAVFGNGGSIKITTQGLFGILPNTSDMPFTSDITARSEFGVDGTIDTSLISANPVGEVTTLPVVLAQKILKAECFGTRRGSNRDSFIFSGRGGLPTTPADPDQNLAVWQDFRAVTPVISQGNSTNAPLPRIVFQNIAPVSQPIIEAQGFSFEPDGSVRLVASASVSPPPSQTCVATQATSTKSSSVSASGR